MNNLISTILIISGIGLFFGYTNFIWNGNTGSQNFTDKSIKELLVDKVRYEDALNKAMEIEEIRNGLLSKYNSIDETNRKRIMKMLPDHIDSVRLIIDINNLATAYGMSLSDIKLSEEADKPLARKDKVSLLEVSSANQFSSKTLDFSVTGRYENFIAFLKDVEKSLRLVDIISVDISSSDGNKQDSSTGEYSYKVSLKTYYLETTLE